MLLVISSSMHALRSSREHTATAAGITFTHIRLAFDVIVEVVSIVYGLSFTVT